MAAHRGKIVPCKPELVLLAQRSLQRGASPSLRFIMNGSKADSLFRAAVWLRALMLRSVEHHLVARLLVHALGVVNRKVPLIEAALHSE